MSLVVRSVMVRAGLVQSGSPRATVIDHGMIDGKRVTTAYAHQARVPRRARPRRAQG